MLRELGHDLLPLEAVRETILASVAALEAESCPLGEAFGRVLRQDLVARDPVPPFDCSAMDGYAVRAADLEGASQETPMTLRVQGALAAGQAPAAALAPGACVRIMTGAPLVPGTEAVVPHELVRFDRERATFFAPVRRGQNIRAAGSDLRPSDVPLRAGVLLRGPQLALAASMGYARVEATRPLRVAVLSPGDELVDVGARPGPGKIRNSNAFSLAGALRDAGAEPIDIGIVPDAPEAILGALRRAFAAGADAAVSSGGVSAGDHDCVQAVIRAEGRPGHVFKVAMRPGKPQAFGLLDGRPVFGLPGNPAAAIISFEVFVRPALRKLRGESETVDRPFGVRFPFSDRYKTGRVFLLRARLVPDDAHPAGGFQVAPPGEQDSSHLASLAAANAIVFLPAQRGEVRAGEVMPAVWLGGRP